MVADALTVQCGVDHISQGQPAMGKVGVCGRPVQAEVVEACALALSTWPVTGGKRRGLIEKEERCVATRRHRLARAPLEIEHTDDPAPALIAAHGTIAIVVQAAAIAHQRAARRCGNQVSERVNTILARHGRPFLACHSPEIVPWHLGWPAPMHHYTHGSGWQAILLMIPSAQDLESWYRTMETDRCGRPTDADLFCSPRREPRQYRARFLESCAATSAYATWCGPGRGACAATGQGIYHPDLVESDCPCAADGRDPGECIACTGSHDRCTPRVGCRDL